MHDPQAGPIDVLPPSREMAEVAWAGRVADARRQLDATSTVASEPRSYGYADRRFRLDPRRTDDDVLAALLDLHRPTDTWLDIGAGVGRFALPLALRVDRVIALEPSEEALRLLLEDAQRSNIDGIDTVEATWPMADDAVPQADVVLMAHVGYAVDNIGTFLDAAEASAQRMCVAVMGESPMSIAPRLLWPLVHGEPRIIGPAFPELLTVLLSRGALPTVSYAERAPVVRPSLDDLVAMARRQLRVEPRSEDDARLIEAVGQVATRREDGWALEWTSTRIGIAAWEPKGRR